MIIRISPIDPSRIRHANPAEKERILAAAKLALQRNALYALFWMTDKCLPQLYALRSGNRAHKNSLLNMRLLTYTSTLVFSDAYIRLCQYHAAHAFIEWSTDGGESRARPKISVQLKFCVWAAFQYAQRCRDREEWPTYRQRFFQRIAQAVDAQTAEEIEFPQERGDQNWTFVPRYRKGRKVAVTDDHRHQQKEYLYWFWDTHWFNSDWLGKFMQRYQEPSHCAHCYPSISAACTDMGVPPGLTRSDIWNTNNHLERAFRTIDTVFLDSTYMKRYD